MEQATEKMWNTISCASKMKFNTKFFVSSRIMQRQSYFQFEFKDIVWKNVIIFLYLHGAAVYGIYLLAIGEAKLMTFILGMQWWLFLFVWWMRRHWRINRCVIAGYAYGTIGAFGITAGAHRLWAHKSYKATWQLRLLLATANLIAFQNCIHEWVRDHRVHHKYTDTNADPHNSKRGFFFSHMGWLVLRKHPDVKSKGGNISMADLEQDEIVMFQKRWGFPAFCFALSQIHFSRFICFADIICIWCRHSRSSYRRWFRVLFSARNCRIRFALLEPYATWWHCISRGSWIVQPTFGECVRTTSEYW